MALTNPGKTFKVEKGGRYGLTLVTMGNDPTAVTTLARYGFDNVRDFGQRATGDGDPDLGLRYMEGTWPKDNADLPADFEDFMIQSTVRLDERPIGNAAPFPLWAKVGVALGAVGLLGAVAMAVGRPGEYGNPSYCGDCLARFPWLLRVEKLSGDYVRAAKRGDNESAERAERSLSALFETHANTREEARAFSLAVEEGHRKAVAN